MALPKIFQMLFGNGGKGPKLREDILPEIDVGVTSVNGNAGDITPEQTGCLPLSGGSVTGNVTVQGKNVVRSVNGITADDSGNIDLSGVLPVGTVIAIASNQERGGFLLCNGGAVSRTTYAKLFEAIGTTYGSGDGSTTFNLPNLTDKFIQGSGTAGTVKSAGLPNIWGQIRVANDSYRMQVEGAEGAFDYRGWSQIAKNNGGSGTQANTDIYFNANNCSEVYGRSETVQPPALTMRYYIKY